MNRMLLLRFDAPLMSFGGSMVDSIGVTNGFPGKSLITGLLANAMGWCHNDFEQLERLQERIRYAVRQDHPGTLITDYQTVDLGQPFLTSGWTTRGKPEGREGGIAKKGTHIRQRDYLADAVFTIALELPSDMQAPTLDDLYEALLYPARPLFLGRKSCLPGTNVLHDCCEADCLLAALRETPLVVRNHMSKDAQDRYRVPAWWPQSEAAQGIPVTVTDERDWRNQIHVGRSVIMHGTIEVTGGV